MSLMLFGSCAVSQDQIKDDSPKTLGERYTSYSYTPLDPLPVFTEPGKSCGNHSEDHLLEDNTILDALPDQAVRFAVGEINAYGSISFGPFKSTVKGKSYQVILDYVNVDVAYLPVYINRKMVNAEKFVSVFDLHVSEKSTYQVFPADRFNEAESINQKAIKEDGSELVIVPVYVGVGLRLTASIYAKEGGINLSGLGALSVAAQAGKINGSLTIQTLGITGSNVDKSLPLPSEINQSTIQNVILSIGSIKATLRDKENTIVEPRVVGIYNPIGGGQDFINGIISQLAGSPIVWYRRCL